MEIITFTKVKLPYGWMSNMSPHPVQFGGKTWRTAEHLFQALRFPEDSPVRELIHVQDSPMTAKFTAKSHASEMVVNPRTDEDLELMRRVIRLKWAAHQQIRSELRSTGDAELVEDVSNRRGGRPSESDLYWGLAHARIPSLRRGENWLGRLWMELRSEVCK